MRITLAKKLASMLDGVDVSDVREGDAIDLPARDATVLIAEGWALPADHLSQDPEPAGEQRNLTTSASNPPSKAPDVTGPADRASNPAPPEIVPGAGVHRYD